MTEATSTLTRAALNPERDSVASVAHGHCDGRRLASRLVRLSNLLTWRLNVID